MKVLRIGERNPIKHGQCSFYVYDETEVYNREAVERRRIDADFPTWTELFKESFLEGYLANLKIMYKRAYGHPLLCDFVVYKDGKIAFSFDNERQYTPSEMKRMMVLANRAKRRCKFL